MCVSTAPDSPDPLRLTEPGKALAFIQRRSPGLWKDITLHLQGPPARRAPVSHPGLVPDRGCSRLLQPSLKLGRNAASERRFE